MTNIGGDAASSTRPKNQDALYILDGVLIREGICEDYYRIIRALIAASRYRNSGLNVLESNELDIAMQEIKAVYP